MFFRGIAAAAVGLGLFATANAQAVASLPDCVSQCIDQSTDATCAIADTKCICRASAGNFLPDLVACVHSTCIYTLDANMWLKTLQTICDLVGVPLSSQAVENAQNSATSLQSGMTATTIQVTVSVTVSPTPTPIIQTFTRTGVSDGSSVVIVYPSTVAYVSGGTTFSAGFSSTSGSKSTSSTTSTTTGIGSSSQTTEASATTTGTTSSSDSSTATTLTTTVAGQQTTGSVDSSPAGATPAPSPSTDSSPLTPQGAASRERVTGLFGLAVAVGWFAIWL